MYVFVSQAMSSPEAGRQDNPAVNLVSIVLRPNDNNEPRDYELSKRV